jgi:hypothetical protein
MINFLRRLWRDRLGNVAVIAALALPVVIGSAGLATDAVQWAVFKRQMQRMADSAALAGAYAKAEGTTLDSCAAYSSATYAQPIGYDVKKNNRVWPTLTCAATNPPTVGGYTADKTAVRVALSVTQSLPFSSVYMTNTPTISATAVAKLVQTGKYCLVALNNTSTVGITMGGSAQANLGCGAISDSTNTTSAITSNGNAYQFNATPIAAVGGMPTSINGCSGCDLQPYHIPEPDPFYNLYPTDIPTGMTCDSFANNSYNTNPSGQVTQSNGSNVTHRLKAGCYTDFSPSGSTTYVMDAGVYYLKDTSFNPGGSVTLDGSAGVTIILTGTNPGTVSLSGNQTLKLKAQSTGTYAKMLFIQSSNASTSNNSSTFNGSSSSYFDGVFYLPKGNITLNGTSTNQTQCAMIVGWTVTISGNSTIQNDTSGCTNNTTVAGYTIKLVE